MITLADLKTAFADYRYYYGSAPIGTKLPYLVAQSTDTENFSADNKVFSKKSEMVLEFYTKSKNESQEEGIETILDSLGLFWDKVETRDEDGEFFLIIYSFWR